MTVAKQEISLAAAALAIEAYVAKDIPPFLHGAPGIGKSELVHQVGKKLGRKVIDFRASLRDPVDLRGMPSIDMTGGVTRWLKPDELPRVDRDGEFGFLFMDELNVASQAMMSACFGLVLERRVGEYELPKGWIPIAAGNRMADRAAAQRMPSALRNRFAHLYVEADLEAWCDWAAKNKISPLLIAFMRFRQNLLHMMPNGDEHAFPTPRAWEKVNRVMDEADAQLRHILISGIVGPGAAAECEGFLRLWKHLPSISSMLSDPLGTHVPAASEPAQMYAVSSALAHKVTRPTFANAITYIKRLPAEFGVIMVKEAVARDPSLKECEAFTKWAIDNAEIVI